MGTGNKTGEGPQAISRLAPQTLVWIRLGRKQAWLARVERDDGGRAVWLRLVGLEGHVRIMVPRMWLRRAARTREQG
ncbi:MAG: hypothetical protein D6690_05190 [Nitrospirae bacterium]|nr:MAG: hypothetical protein D6690_05190 [Nitrospirota bacterium]